MVAHRLNEPRFPEEVVESLRADPGLNDALRREAIRIAEAAVVHSRALEGTARIVVRQPGSPIPAYLLARRRAEVVCRLIPHEASYWTTLGLAQYRLGQDGESVASMTRAWNWTRGLVRMQIPQAWRFSPWPPIGCNGMSKPARRSSGSNRP